MNCDRCVFVKPFDPPLARNHKVGVCLFGNWSWKEVNCRTCGLSGSIGLVMNSAQVIMVFKEFIQPLSNRHACQLQVYGKNFKRLEHAYYFQMAIEFGLANLAENIQNAIHAGEANRLADCTGRNTTWLGEPSYYGTPAPRER